MKRIIALLMLATFSIEPAAFAAGVTSVEARVEKVQTSDNHDNLDVFENNYQEVIDSKTKTTSLSPIEEMFNDKEAAVSGRVLTQAGYNLFTSGGSSTAVGGKFDDNYKLNIGESINIYTTGDSVDIMAMSGSSLITPSSTTKVDSKGNIFIQGVGVVKAENRTIAEVERDANRLAQSKFKSLHIKLTVAGGQEFSVFVYGQVAHPGKVLVGNNSSLLDALNAAGGVKKTGTLRNIRYTSSSSKNKSQNIDLYKALFSGNDDGIILRPNDKIFVDKIGKVVALKNGVTVPGIYEFKDGENIYSVISYAGGLLPATQLTEVTMTGFDANTRERVAKNVTLNELKTTKLQSGDSVMFRELYNTAENTVTIQGNIKHPATYAYKDGMRLSDILKSEKELLEETFIYQAVIRRVSGDNNQIETIPIFLKEFFAGMNDPLLKPKDVISIYKNTNSQFVDVYGCINKPKHLTYKEGMTLYSLMTDVKFIESDVSDKIAENSTEESEVPVTLKGNVDKDDVQLSGETANSNKLIPTENVAVEIMDKGGNTVVYYLYDIMINSDRIKSIKLSAEDRVFFRTLRDNETVKSVKISGFVNTPGVYKFVEGKHLVDMIKDAGGLSKDADMRGIVFKRANIQGRQVELAVKNNDRDVRLLEGRIASGYKQSKDDQSNKMDMINLMQSESDNMSSRYTGQIALNIKDNNLNKIKDIDNLLLQDGDDIYIPRMATQVSVIGEVYNEQSFIFQPNTKVKDYVKLVGGYTPNANRFRLYKVGVNGRAIKVRKGTRVAAGDTIVVPRRIAGNDYISPICDTLRGLASLVVMAFAINRW